VYPNHIIQILGLTYQLLYGICRPILYTNCYIGNVSSLPSVLRSDDAIINKTERLHLYSGTYHEEPPYIELICKDMWPCFTSPDRLLDNPDEVPLYCVVDEIQTCHSLGLVLKEKWKKDPAFLSRLDTVSLGDNDNLTWTMAGARQTERTLLMDEKCFDTKLTPHFLVALPNVKNACQSTLFGPLSLVACFYTMSNPPMIFNYHAKLPPLSCTCDAVLGPIILGTTNRLFFGCLYCVDKFPPSAWRNTRDLVSMRAILQRFDAVQVIDLGNPDSSVVTAPLDQVDIGNTKVELYDYIRITNPISGDPHQNFRGCTLHACRPATSLRSYQQLLDQQLPEKWRGRVILKHREEAPPCTACGLDIKEQWEHTVKTEGYGHDYLHGCGLVHEN
jgi:hypothetical protein